MPPPEKPHPLPRPKPKPPRPKPKPVPEPELKARPRPRSEPRRDQTPGAVPLRPDPLGCAAECSESCAYYGLCPPPPPPTSSSGGATVHLRSSRLPTPLIALSASLLAVSVLLLVALLVCRLARRRRRQAAPQEVPLNHHGEEGVPVQAVAVEEVDDADDGGVHHVWYIRTVGLDERAIAAIKALVYDSKKCGGGGVGLSGGGDDDGSCAVCLAEFRDGETLRLLPRCSHAFHRGCIDTWLRAHVNCPLCRAPVQVAADRATAVVARQGTATGAAAREPGANHGAAGVTTTEEADRDGAMPERVVRRAASMMALPRRAWPEVSLRAPASNSGREGEMGMGLAKISRRLKLSEALEMAGVGAGRSVSFGAASCLRLPGRSGPSATGVNTDEMSR